ncbi:MAG: phosphosulfolactate synthase [Burkholderiales bacterium]|nr:phosphosulfolactate synthase [Burkholderiales bacterium]
MRQGAFGMLEVPAIPPKPRERFMIGVSEVGIPLRATEDLLEVAAPLIDYAKITDHTGLVDRLSGGWLRRKITLYNAAGIDVLPGGIPFQLALVQGRVDEYFRAVRDFGFAGIELSDDVIVPMKEGRREELIGRARELGLKVTTEVGRKNLDAALDVDATAQRIARDLELGVCKVYLESAEIQAVAERDPAGLDRLIASVDRSTLLFELGLNQPLEKAAWLAARYGADVNFASVAPQDVVPVDAIRRGMNRKSGYAYLAGARAER